jgi:hypothetical protein
VALVAVLLLMFRKPAPVAPPMKASEVAAHAESFQQKISALAPQPASTNADGTSYSTDVPAEVRLTVDEVQAALAQANDPAMAAAIQSAGAQASGGTAQTPSADQIAMPTSAPVVTFENDVVKGQFETQLAGQKVYVTVAGHLGAKDGYATFDPTEFKIGDVTVPVSMVNSSLQKKMEEQRDRLKLPDFISDIAVQNGELVIRRK